MTTVDSIDQSDRRCRLKALEFIRLYLESTEEDFCQHLIENEHLSLEKTFLISRIIQQFLFISNQSMKDSSHSS